MKKKTNKIYCSVCKKLSNHMIQPDEQGYRECAWCHQTATKYMPGDSNETIQ